MWVAGGPAHAIDPDLCHSSLHSEALAAKRRQMSFHLTYNARLTGRRQIVSADVAGEGKQREVTNTVTSLSAHDHTSIQMQNKQQSCFTPSPTSEAEAS